MATYESNVLKKRFFAENSDGETFPITYKRGMVIVKTNGGNVVFTKTNRSNQFGDSRGRKVVTKNEWGDKVEKILPLMISEDEVKSELLRLLDTPEQAAAAFQSLL